MPAPIAHGTLFLQLLLVAGLVVGVRRRNHSMAVNAFVAVVATILPRLVELTLVAAVDPRVTIDGLVPFWIAAAGCLHLLGMAGWYESTWWWDHLTHVVSAAFVAAAVAGVIHGVHLGTPTLRLTPPLVDGFTLLFTAAVGVFWELGELLVHRYSRALGIQSLLIPYGPRDTAFDLVFDVVGALVVIAFDVRILVDLARAAPGWAFLGLIAAAGLVGGGSILAGAVLVVTRA